MIVWIGERSIAHRFSLQILHCKLAAMKARSPVSIAFNCFQLFDRRSARGERERLRVSRFANTAVNAGEPLIFNSKLAIRFN